MWYSEILHVQWPAACRPFLFQLIMRKVAVNILLPFRFDPVQAPRHHYVRKNRRSVILLQSKILKVKRLFRGIAQHLESIFSFDWQ